MKVPELFFVPANSLFQGIAKSHVTHSLQFINDSQKENRKATKLFRTETYKRCDSFSN